MSDFDKEAEREKLRERFAEEDEKRETTEQMSELLLQGATMTDTHCDSCGNPLFRYDGQTFCPTCQQTATAGETDDQAVAGDDTPVEGEAATASMEGQQTTTEQSDARPSHPPQTTAPRQNAGPRQARRAPPSRTDDASAAEQEPRAAARSASGTDDLAATEQSLARTLAELTATAEGCDDLGRTREHLAATREAAEALDAVRTARR
jgi:uncharacterized Zn finger protein (UPF0148 family)